MHSITSLIRLYFLSQELFLLGAIAVGYDCSERRHVANFVDIRGEGLTRAYECEDLLFANPGQQAADGIGVQAKIVSNIFTGHGKRKQDPLSLPSSAPQYDFQ